MDNKQLQEIKVRCEAATPGPWTHQPEYDEYGREENTRYLPEPWINDVDLPDAEFIAHARQDVPDLVKEVERLQNINSELAQALQDNLLLIEEHGSMTMKAHATRLNKHRHTIGQFENEE